MNPVANAQISFLRSLILGMVFTIMAIICGANALPEELGVLTDESTRTEDRLHIGGRILQSLYNPKNAAFEIALADTQPLASAAYRLVGSKEASLAEMGAHILMALPPSSFDEMAVRRLQQSGSLPGLAVRLAVLKIPAASLTDVVLLDALSTRNDIVSFELAAEEMLNRNRTDIIELMMTALSDQRLGIKLAAARFIVGMPSKVVLPRSSLAGYMAEAEKLLEERKTIEKYLPKSSASGLVSEEERYAATIRIAVERAEQQDAKAKTNSSSAPAGLASSPHEASGRLDKNEDLVGGTKAMSAEPVASSVSTGLWIWVFVAVLLACCLAIFRVKH